MLRCIIKSGICPSTWRRDTLGPLGEISSILLRSMWLGHGDEISRERVEVALSVTRLNSVWWYRWTGYGDTVDQVSDKASIDETKGMGLNVNGSTTKLFRGMHGGHYGHPGPADDHWSERCLVHVRSVPEPRVTHLRCWWHFRYCSVIGMIWLWLRENRNGSDRIRRMFEVVQKVFRSIGNWIICIMY